MKSPLRYPGGKTRACKILDTIVPHKPIMLSPFVGGASFELYRGGTWFANDLFEPLYTFWTELQKDRDGLVRSVNALRPMTKELFKELRASPNVTASQFFALNRSSFSGATFCGGFSQESALKRFTESSIKRLYDVNLDSFTFSNMDAQKFLAIHPQTEDTWVYADPPYYIQTYIYGRDGDLHEAFDHVGFAKCIRDRTDWTICYNDCAFIRELYKGCNIQSVSWAYGMNPLKDSSEIIITAQ